jgi:Clp amino terminal domain, pathogenicity island component
MFERYTEKARRVIFFARYEAAQFGAPYIETEHLLLGLLRENRALIHKINLPISYESAHQKLEARAYSGKKISTSVDLPLSHEGKRVLAYAAEEAEALNHRHIGAEHLLLGLLREAGCLAGEVLRESGADLEVLRSKIAGLPVPWNESQVSPGELPVYIHGRALGKSYIERLARDSKRFFWEKKQFTAPDIVVRRGDGAVSFDLKLADDSDNFELVKGGWQEITCRICRWQLADTGDPEPGAAYTNGRDWLCSECYEKFVSPEPGKQT